MGRGKIEYMDVVPDTGTVGRTPITAIDLHGTTLSCRALEDDRHEILRITQGQLTDLRARMGTNRVEVTQQRRA